MKIKFVLEDEDVMRLNLSIGDPFYYGGKEYTIIGKNLLQVGNTYSEYELELA